MAEITLNHITKIEGHAKLRLVIDKGTVTACDLDATEGARYFEGIVIGRRYNEATEITSRICGICSAAHVVASITAIENALGYTPSEQTRQLRILLTLAERIRSHATHLYFLALPDYLGYESALAMAKDYKPQLQSALRLMQAGNKIMKVLAGRDLHPVSATVGGWLKLPTAEDMVTMREALLGIEEDAVKTCELFSELRKPAFASAGEWFSLVDPKEYAVIGGTFTSPKQSFAPAQYQQHIDERHTPTSTANFVTCNGKPYFVGALSRLNNSSAQLSDNARRALRKSGLVLPSRNVFDNNLAQAIELVHCIDHALHICNTLTIRPEPVANIPLRAGTGVGAVEVPRGTLWHEYTLDEHGTITGANIITPTAQNLLNIQEDIRTLMPSLLELPKERIILDVEKLIRSYDPCFSCSAHFLEVEWEERGGAQ